MRIPPISVAKFAALAAIVAALFALAWRFNLPLDDLRALVSGIDPAIQYPAFVAIYALISVAPVPGRDVVKLTGAFLYGGWASAWLVYFGEIAAVFVTWGLGQTLGRDLIERLLAGRLESLKARIRGANWRQIALLRVFPGTPYRFMNYAAAVTPIPGAPYLMGCVVGTWPRTVFFQLVFGATGATLAARGVTTLQIVAVSVGFVLVVGAIWAIRRHLRSRRVASCEP
ncbi:MAG: VTT domain-containing protein [Deltaproteobacteria bacterium]|nr:VTT domain-containing protein [Deltaproteobacteria bacterium]